MVSKKVKAGVAITSIISTLGLGFFLKDCAPSFQIDYNKKTKKIDVHLGRLNLFPYSPSLDNNSNSQLEKLINQTIKKNIQEKNKFFLIDKSDRQLVFYDKGKIKYNFPIAVGENKSDKNILGDEATPEGIFYVCTINPTSKYRTFYGISYPNVEDAKRGLENELINKSEYDSIVSAIKGKKKTPWNTILGGSLGIHGPIKKEKKIRLFGCDLDFQIYFGSLRNGTWGCIATDNRYLEKLKKDIRYGDQVIIRK